MSAKPLFVAASDNHLEYCSYASYPDLWGDSYFSLQQQVDHAILLDVPLVLAGDVFDKQYPDAMSVVTTVQQLHRLRQKNIPVFFVQGQHEFSRRKPWLSVVENAIHLDRQQQLLGSYKIAGIDWSDIKRFCAVCSSPELASADIVVCHQPWVEFMGQHVANQWSLVELIPKQAQLVVTGDYHCHQRLIRSRPDGTKLTVLSPGSACLQSIQEEPEKKFFVVYDDLSVTSVPLKTRRVLDVTVKSSEHAEKSLEWLVKTTAHYVEIDSHYLPENILKPIWIVRYATSLKGFFEDVKEAAQNIAHLFPRPFADTPAEVVWTLCDKQSNSSVPTLEESLQDFVAPSSPEHTTALRLLRAASVRDEIATIVTEKMAETHENKEVSTQ